MDKLSQMKAVIAVMDAGGFTAAGRSLGWSTALVSKYVGALEEDLGTRLLNRTTRQVAPTQAGAEYRRRIEPLLAELDTITEDTRSSHDTPRGLLRVAAPRVFGSYILTPLVGEFLALYPDIQLDLQMDERQVDIIEDGFDVALRMAPMQDSSLIARKLIAMPFVHCASRAYLEAAGTPSHPRELSGHATLVNTAITPSPQWRFQEQSQPFTVAIKPRIKVNTARAVADLVLRDLGVGLCLLPTVQNDIADGRLIRLFESYEAYRREVYALYPQARFLPTKVRAFIDFLSDRLR